MMARPCLALCALILTACHENQKEQVREIETREARTSASVAKSTRREMENSIEDKLSGMKFKLDDARTKVATAGPNANQRLLDQLSKDIDALDQQIAGVRGQFDQLKSMNDEQFAGAVPGIQSQMNDLRQSYERFMNSTRY